MIDTSIYRNGDIHNKLFTFLTDRPTDTQRLLHNLLCGNRNQLNVRIEAGLPPYIAKCGFGYHFTSFSINIFRRSMTNSHDTNETQPYNPRPKTTSVDGWSQRCKF